MWPDGWEYTKAASAGGVPQFLHKALADALSSWVPQDEAFLVTRPAILGVVLNRNQSDQLFKAMIGGSRNEEWAPWRPQYWRRTPVASTYSPFREMKRNKIRTNTIPAQTLSRLLYFLFEISQCQNTNVAIARPGHIFITATYVRWAGTCARIPVVSVPQTV